MSITRLQQARQMYAMGQRVAKTLDGSRPGYRGPGGYQGGSGAPGSAESSGSKGNGSKGNGSKGNGGNGGTQHSPHTKSGYTGPTNYGPQQPPQEIIGGKSFNVTPDTRDERERARVKQSILDAPIPNITDKGISFFKDGNLLNSFLPGDNPLSKPKSFGLLDLALIAASGGLFGAKVATGAKMFNTAKNISKFANDIGLTDKNVVGAFTDNFTSNFSDKFSGFGKGKKSTTKNNTINNGSNGDGITSLDNQASGYDEYILLLQKLQSGNISDAERNRYNTLKNMLGI